MPAPHMQDLEQPATKIITDLINAANGTNFAPTDWVFGTPTANPVGSERNTDLKIAKVATPDKKTTIHYNRLDLGVLGNQDSGMPAFTAAQGHTTIGDLLPALNTALGIQLTTDDVYDDPLDLVDDGAWPHAYVVRAKPTSLCYFGQFSGDLAQAA